MLYRIVGTALILMQGASSMVQADTNGIRQELTNRLRDDLKNTRSEPELATRWVKEAKLLNYLGRTLSNDAEKEKVFTEGRLLAAKARQAEATNPGAILWWTANEGNIAAIHKDFSALKSIGQIEKTLLLLKEIDPGYEYAAADRALARIYQEAPPFISIGSRRKSNEHYRAALQKAPDYPGNQIAFANFLLQQGEREQAMILARKVRSSEKLKDFPFDAPEWIENAERILEKAQHSN